MAEMTFLVMKGVAFESGFGSGKFWLCLTEEEELFVLIVLSGSYNLPSYNVEYQFWFISSSLPRSQSDEMKFFQGHVRGFLQKVAFLPKDQ